MSYSDHYDHQQIADPLHHPDYDDTDHGAFEPLPFSLACFGFIMAACVCLDRLGWL